MYVPFSKLLASLMLGSLALILPAMCADAAGSCFHQKGSDIPTVHHLPSTNRTDRVSD